MGIIYSGKTDIGRKRKTNQDSIYIGPDELLFIVADGMGGHNGGDIASQMAVKVFPQAFEEFKSEEITKCIRNSFKQTNGTIYQKSQDEEELKGMGTTLVGYHYYESHLYVFNIGDSRAYLINQDSLFQLSKDHSLVQEKLNLGIYTREEAAEDKQKNVLIRTVGFEPEVDCDIFNFKVHKNDIFMICSDGLHGYVSDPDILHIISKHLPDPSIAKQENVDAAVEELVTQANENGGNDNISVIVTVAK
ncbi:MAG: Stp1/IreP family PP2C-type Ser/Thr phosphatase [Bacteriovoracaceae bacterium]|jgi:PPM family protein phosphatase|nr:Stp1/IreP family PP2C-type Ser/Thr phosphatase [Bacteriovoracaceae bacterium]